MRRWFIFNAVGVAGFAVQLGALALLLRTGVPYLWATGLAVEMALLHNFAWHERWTWRDRPASGGPRLARLGRFHLANGVVSLLGNLAIMRALVGVLGAPPLAANAVAVVVCAALNYLAGDRLVFAGPRLAPPASRVASMTPQR